MTEVCLTECSGLSAVELNGGNCQRLMAPDSPCILILQNGGTMRNDGTLEAVFRDLSSDADMENLSLDSTCIKVHESANGGDKAVGRTRGGLNTKLHTVADGLGNPVEPLLSAGNDHYSIHAIELLKRIEISGSSVLADWAYSPEKIYSCISEYGASYAIPPQSTCFTAVVDRLVSV